MESWYEDYLDCRGELYELEDRELVIDFTPSLEEVGLELLYFPAA